jgi:putative endonuclease
VYYVYVLRSVVNYRLYTGYTKDIERRLAEHNSGKTKYTRLTKPFELVYKEGYNTSLEAARREKFLKSGKGRELLKEILGA